MSDAEADDGISPEEFWYWSEFCAWVAVILSPLLWWFNGPSVSTDQFWVRSGLVTVSGLAAVSLRTRKLLIDRASARGRGRQQ